MLGFTHRASPYVMMFNPFRVLGTMLITIGLHSMLGDLTLSGFEVLGFTYRASPYVMMFNPFRVLDTMLKPIGLHSMLGDLTLSGF